jgi:hypothetical protein
MAYNMDGLFKNKGVIENQTHDMFITRYNKMMKSLVFIFLHFYTCCSAIVDAACFNASDEHVR